MQVTTDPHAAAGTLEALQAAWDAPAGDAPVWGDGQCAGSLGLRGDGRRGRTIGALPLRPQWPAVEVAPYRVEIDEPRAGALRTAVRLWDRGATVVYRLGARGRDHRWAFGFTEHVLETGGGVTSTPVSAAEVAAVAREVGREEEVFAMVEAVLDCVGERNRRRLRRELAAARNLDRVALPRIQAAILHRLSQGVTLSDLAERGGFVPAQPPPAGKHDTSWLQRRAGLIPHVCRTGKRRIARTADYHVFVMLVRAVDGDPVDFGV